jgi:uncharacterized protein (TIGR03492 family)
VQHAQAPSILLISNGHGEDLNGGLIAERLKALRPDLRLAALPIVGRGQAYTRRGIPLLHQGKSLPSGGMVYQQGNIWRDLRAGLLVQTLRQAIAAWRHRRHIDLVLCVGDHVPMAFALLTCRPTVAFLVSTSSFYEGRMRIPAVTRWFCQRRLTRAILTRDAYTATDLRAQGLVKARFCGYPIMDLPQAPGDADPAAPGVARLALLPGSRLPEARHNLVLMLRLCAHIQAAKPSRVLQVQAAVVDGVIGSELDRLAAALGWSAVPDGLRSPGGHLVVAIRHGAFAEILHGSQLAVGMAGTAVEQAVGLGLPVVQIVGAGPQFTYAFAESQMRLLGSAVHTVGHGPAGEAELQQAADLVWRLLDDPAVQAHCREVGLERVGAPGGSEGIARAVLAQLGA